MENKKGFFESFELEDPDKKTHTTERWMDGTTFTDWKFFFDSIYLSNQF